MSLKLTRTDFTLYPLTWLAICFALGIFAEKFFAFDWKFYVALLLIFAVLAAVFVRKAAVFLFAAFVALGALCFQVEKLSVSSDRLKILYDENVFTSGDPIEITGVLRGRPESAVGGFFLEMRAESAVYKGAERRVSGNVRLFAPASEPQIIDEYAQLDLRHGRRIRIACNLKRDEKFLNPGVISAKEILDQKEIDAAGIIKSPLLVEVLDTEETFVPVGWVFDRRQNLIEEFQRIFSGKTAGVLIASLFGNRYFLDRKTSEIFREGGTFHLLVISGLQITFIGGAAIFIVRLFTRNRLLQFLLAGGFLWIYSLGVGADAPVVRAALMFTVLIFGETIFRRATLLNSLGAAALALLVWRPSDLFDQSFQLTFACVAAIVAAAFPLLEKMRAVGEWQPSAETPVPPACGKIFRAFCEALYWSERKWQFEQSQNVWSCRLFKTPLAEKLERFGIQKILRLVFETLLVSLIVQAWLVPFMVVYFHRISLSGIFLNVWAGILTAVESLTAITAVALAQFSDALAAPMVLLTEIANLIILQATAFFVKNEWASLRIPHYTGAMGFIYVLYFVPILFLTVLIHRWKPFELVAQNSMNQSEDEAGEERRTKTESSKFQLKIAAASYFFLFSIVIFHPFSAPAADGLLHVEFLDVGQGDAAFLTMPSGETLLVDGGGKINFKNLYLRQEDEEPEPFEPDARRIGESVVSEFLWEKGYSQIDYVLATHADADHIQGLADVVKNFRVRAAIFGRTPFEDADFAEVFEALEKRNVPILTVSRGDIFEFGEVRIEVLNPKSDESETTVSENNNSLVLRVRFGETEFLLTGDIEKETESFLVQTPELLQADVVKVAHHGSRTSSTEDFVKAAKAKIAVISVGRDSIFGHPRPEVVERWKDSGAKVLTTGENGTISFSTDGKILQMKTFSGRAVYR